MHIRGKFIFLFFLIVFSYVSLFTTERSRQDFLRVAKIALSNNPNLPSIESIPSFVAGECKDEVVNPEYQIFIERESQKCLDEKNRTENTSRNTTVDLTDIWRNSCKRKALLSTSAPMRTVELKRPCDRVAGYKKWFKLHGILWFKVGYEERKGLQIGGGTGETYINNTIVCSDGKSSINTDRTIEIVKELPEVKSYIQLFSSKQSKPIIEVDNDEEKEGQNWSVHVYENVNDSNASHAATFNWYTVDKCTGSIKCSFSKYDKQGNLTGVSSESEYPCK